MDALKFLEVATEFAILIAEGGKLLADANQLAATGKPEEAAEMLQNSMDRYAAASDAYRHERNPNEDVDNG